MEKINVAELLCNCPKGMELDCTMYEDVQLGYIASGSLAYPIKIQTPDGQMSLNKYGCYSNNKDAKCIIFPKGKTTWEGFVPPCKFKDGEILYLKTVYEYECIFINKTVKELPSCEPKYYKYASFNEDLSLIVDDSPITYKTNVKEIRLATEEEKEKLFDTIKANGYKWNSETKTLEKLVTIFKVGDKIKLKNSYAKKYDDFNTRKITEIKHSHYILDDEETMPLSNQYLYELVPNKFDINTLKPFESRVLARDKNTDKWKSNFWGFYDIDNAMNYPYECCGTSFAQCIPYEGNQHLLGKTDDCDDFYKIW